jgi:hypothetical protein
MRRVLSFFLLFLSTRSLAQNTIPAGTVLLLRLHSSLKEKLCGPGDACFRARQFCDTGRQWTALASGRTDAVTALTMSLGHPLAVDTFLSRILT